MYVNFTPQRANTTISSLYGWGQPVFITPHFARSVFCSCEVFEENDMHVEIITQRTKRRIRKPTQYINRSPELNRQLRDLQSFRSPFQDGSPNSAI